MLKVDNVCSGYGDIQIVNGISITVEDRSVVAIVGSNGVGKSTLLKTITGMIPTTSGNATFDEKRITGLSTNQILELVYIILVAILLNMLKLDLNCIIGEKSLNLLHLLSSFQNVLFGLCLNIVNSMHRYLMLNK